MTSTSPTLSPAFLGRALGQNLRHDQAVVLGGFDVAAQGTAATRWVGRRRRTRTQRDLQLSYQSLVVKHDELQLVARLARLQLGDQLVGRLEHLVVELEDQLADGEACFLGGSVADRLETRKPFSACLPS